MAKRSDDEPLLLPYTLTTREERKPSLLFKVYVIISMTLLWTGYTLLVRYTRSTARESERILSRETMSILQLYASTTVVLNAELTKGAITLLMILQTNGFRFKKFRHCLAEYFIGQPWELLKISVPSIAYALQNNLDFVALSNLDAGVTTQLKVVTTALFMIVILGRHFSYRRWLAIFLLFVGVAVVQVNVMNVEGKDTDTKPTLRQENYTVGLTAVLFTCVTAGFAGVYFEKILKDGGPTPFWVRNLQMYSCGAVAAAIGCLGAERDIIEKNGYLHGYGMKTWAIVGCLGIGGVYIGLVMKHLDNLHKSFASAVSIILVVLLSTFIFPAVRIGSFFIAGAALVCTAIVLYNSVPD